MVLAEIRSTLPFMERLAEEYGLMTPNQRVWFEKMKAAVGLRNN